MPAYLQMGDSLRKRVWSHLWCAGAELWERAVSSGTVRRELHIVNLCLDAQARAWEGGQCEDSSSSDCEATYTRWQICWSIRIEKRTVPVLRRGSNAIEQNHCWKREPPRMTTAARWRRERRKAFAGLPPFAVEERVSPKARVFLVSLPTRAFKEHVGAARNGCLFHDRVASNVI